MAYPSVADAFSDKAVRRALDLARLELLVDEIDSEDNWPPVGR